MKTRVRLPVRPAECPECGHTRLARPRPRWLRAILPTACGELEQDVDGWGGTPCACQGIWHVVGT